MCAHLENSLFFHTANIVLPRCKTDVNWFSSHLDLLFYFIYRADFRLAPSQWETSLQSNAVSHWLGANLDSALYIYIYLYIYMYISSYCKADGNISYMHHQSKEPLLIVRQTGETEPNLSNALCVVFLGVDRLNTKYTYPWWRHQMETFSA